MDETSIGKEEAVFSFITDQKFRTSLASDYAELLKSLESGAWKAAHVLSGSVVEALLIDFLISMDYEKKSGKNPLELDLSKAVDACRKEGALSDRASALATVIRGYRNLIHPGRMIRLNERVDKNSAAIAKALVDMVISEIADARINKYGFTADQLMLKIEHDSSCAPILPHLLKDMSEYERERLLTDTLPKRHLAHREDGFYPLDALENCFRMAFNFLSDQKKSSVAQRFVAILRHEPEQEVLDYEQAFFHASHMQYLTEGDAAIVRDHLLSQLRTVDAKKLELLNGLAKFLTGVHLSRYFVFLLRAALQERDKKTRDKAALVICEEYVEVDEDRKNVLMQHMENWEKGYEEKGETEMVERASSLKTDMIMWQEAFS
jgi:hypothetical protein